MMRSAGTLVYHTLYSVLVCVDLMFCINSVSCIDAEGGLTLTLYTCVCVPAFSGAFLQSLV